MSRTPQKADYWIIDLHFMTLLRVLKWNPQKPVRRLFYINSTAITSFCLEFLARFKLIRFSLHKIRPRSSPSGPVLHLSEVKDERGRLLTFQVYRSVLEMRRQILNDLLSQFESFPFVHKKNSTIMLEAWLGLKIAEEINPLLFLAYYARWNHRVEVSPERSRNILIIPRSLGNHLLSAYIQNKQLVDEILLVGNRGINLKKVLIVLIRVFLSFLTTIGCWIKKDKDFTSEKKGRKNRIFVPYTLGVDRSQRNDIPFAFSPDFDLSRIVFLMQNTYYLPKASEVLYMKKNDISYFLAPDIPLSSPDVPQWHPSRQRRVELTRFCQTYLKFFLQCLKQRKRYSLWLLFLFWEFGKKTAFWKDFFSSNHVRIAVFPIQTPYRFISSLALSETDGISIEIERSILFDYCTYIHNFPCHIKFVTGPYSLTQIPEPSYSQYVLQSGPIQNLRKNGYLDGFDREKRKGQIVCALFDEIPSDWFFGNSVRELYETMIDLAQKDGRFFLLIKTKKGTVLEKLPDIKAVLLRLQQEGKCRLLNWKISVSAAALSSDLAVSVPSTAVFESILSETPTLVYNPMRVGLRVFYQNGGLNRRVFEEKHHLTAALRRFAGGDLTIGECHDLRPEIDPFQDNRGAERIANYILNCLQAFDCGKSREDILKRTNEWYASQWGEDKLTAEADAARSACHNGKNGD